MRILATMVLCGTMALLPAAQAQPAAPPAQSVTPPESRIALAIDLLKATHAVDNVDAVLNVIVPQQKAALRRAAPNLSDEAIEAIIQGLHDAIIARQDEMLRLYAIEYTRHFSDHELRDLTAFYLSDVGKKYVAQVPLLLKEMAPIMTRWILGVVVQEERNILEKLPKQDKKT